MKAGRLGGLQWLLSATACVWSAAMRPQERNDPLGDVDPADVEDPATPVLPPFEIDLTLKNEEAVLQNSQGTVTGTMLYKVLPQEASLDDAASGLIKDLEVRLKKESNLGCKLEKKGNSGSEIEILMTITSYQLSSVLPKKTAKDFGSSMKALPAALAALGVQQLLYDDILEKAKNFLQAKWIAKMPALLQAKLKENKVESTLRVPAKPLPALIPLPLASLSLALRVELKGRMPLAASANKSATADMVEKMKQKDYLEMVEPKLQEAVSEALRDVLGSFSFEVKAECDADFGHHSKHSFWLRIDISNFDEVQTLQKINGDLAGQARRVLSLLGRLHRCGVPGLEGAASKTRKLLRDGALKNWHIGLAKKIGELLGGEAQAVSGSSFAWLQKKATSGICCRSERKMKADEVFWVSADTTAGAKGHDGMCPAIHADRNPPCVGDSAALKLHHRPYTECFNLPELVDFGQAAELRAPVVSKC